MAYVLQNVTPSKVEVKKTRRIEFNPVPTNVTLIDRTAQAGQTIDLIITHDT